jgi:hypothetical protein
LRNYKDRVTIAQNQEAIMAKTNYDITREQVLEHLSYDGDSGELVYLKDGFKRKAGDPVPIASNVINILGSSYSKMKLIWLIVHGEWPSRKINTRDFGSKDCSKESLTQGGGMLGRELCHERLHEVLDYNQDSGIFTWKISMSSTGRKGAEAGVIGPDGYRKIRADGRLYTAHRLAFLYMTGAWPEDRIDHIDGIRDNNAWVNLRQADASENAQNQYKAQSNNKSSGLLGVYFDKDKSAYGAKVNLHGKQHHAGFHPSPEEAHQAYLQLKKKLHPFGMLKPDA